MQDNKGFRSYLHDLETGKSFLGKIKHTKCKGKIG